MDTQPTDALTLDALQERFGDRYAIRRHGRLWVATDRDRDTRTAPTVIEDTTAKFVAALENPDPRAARPFRCEL